MDSHPNGTGNELVLVEGEDVNVGRWGKHSRCVNEGVGKKLRMVSAGRGDASGGNGRAREDEGSASGGRERDKQLDRGVDDGGKTECAHDGGRQWLLHKRW